MKTKKLTKILFYFHLQLQKSYHTIPLVFHIDLSMEVLSTE